MLYLFFILIQFRGFSPLVGTNIFLSYFKVSQCVHFGKFLRSRCIKCAIYERCGKDISLLAPAQISVSVDGKSEAATGKLFNTE